MEKSRKDQAAPVKRPFAIDAAIPRIRDAVRPFPKAALFELADDRFRSPFEQLVACIISIRTLDEVTLPTARRLFALARTPLEVSRLTREVIGGTKEGKVPGTDIINMYSCNIILLLLPQFSPPNRP